ncbi:MAG: cell division protein FtsZ [Candidatus Hodarchaeales archaeon]|jgi:cell division protein FtsZ
MDTIINSILDNEELEQPTNDFPSFSHQLGTQNSHEMDANIAALLRQSLPKVQMLGIGGAGNNAATRVFKRLEEIGIEDVEIVSINTDAQDLLNSYSNKKVLIGYEITKGFGAGNDPLVGEAAALESAEELKELIDGNLVFIACGLGGGTGTGAASVIAGLAREKGALTVSICTLPFSMEGAVRAKNAASGLKKLYEASDTVVVVPNERLLKLADDLTVVQGFRIADEVLVRAVTAISELITKPQAVNLDFNDVRKVLGQGGVALISLGDSKSQNSRVEEAVKDALNNPLLDDLELSTARKALICVGGGEDLSLREAEAVVQQIKRKIDPSAEIIWGASIAKDKELTGTLRVIVILSDIESSFSDESFTYRISQDIREFMQGIPMALRSANENFSTFETDNLIDQNKPIKENNSRIKRFFRR